jgi:hypothetical protein
MQSPEARDEHVVDALLDGGALLEDPIRMAAVLDELRSRRAEPGVELRARVARVLAAPEVAPRRRRVRPPRRVLAGAALVAACALVAVVALSLSRDHGTTATALPSADRGAVADFEAAIPHASAPGRAGADPGALQRPATLAPSVSRLQDYRATMRLRVAGTRRLSQVTQRTISLTRGFGGYVSLSSVDLRGSRSGDAQVDVHIPIARVQDAIARFSSLGVIVGQHVSVADLQAGYDAATRRREALRHSLALIEIRLADPKTTPEQHVSLLAQRERARHALAGADETAKTLAARGAYATIDLAFVTGATAAPVRPSHPGRLGHAVRRAGSLLETIAIGALFVLILGAPVLALVALVVLAARTRRRRLERALLDRA